jgi:hypothetical protein
LKEFLGLGLRTGYRCLQRLVKSGEQFGPEHSFIAEHFQPRKFAPWIDAEEAAALKQFAKKFQLTHWKNVGHRLVELQRLFLPEVRYSEEFYSDMGKGPDGR